MRAHLDEGECGGVPSWARVLELVDTKPSADAATGRFLEVLIRCKGEEREAMAAQN